VLVLGGSNTGKSTIVRNLLKILEPHIDQAIVINPTIDDNDGYTGVVPRQCIHKVLTEELLQRIWDRQAALCATFRNANRPEVIDSLYAKSRDKRSDRTIEKVIARMRDEMDCAETAEKKESIQKLCEDFVLCIKKNAILEAHKRFASTLNEQERKTINHITLNPRLVLIFDDCTTDIEELKKTKIMREMLYAARHKLITLIMILHDDGALKPGAKKSAAFVMFTDSKTANAYFSRASNGFRAEEKKELVRAAVEIIGNADDPIERRYQRMIFVQNQNKVYTFTAKKYEPFRFGADIIWEFCNRVTEMSEDVGVNNKYTAKIMRD
jgi:ABC-type dipeptide/oligopeptide/nickel transport system ATPase subunit